MDKLRQTHKVPKYVYTIMMEECIPDNRIAFWNGFSISGSINWDKIHQRNFFSSINTRIRSFYFKLFHKAIALNDFLFKIKRKDSPNCSFCKDVPETIVHVFIECNVVKPIWDETISVINQKSNKILIPSIFDKMFGYQEDMFITYIFLVLKYYVNFKVNTPTFKDLRRILKLIKKLNTAWQKRRVKLLHTFVSGDLTYNIHCDHLHFVCTYSGLSLLRTLFAALVHWSWGVYYNESPLY